MAGNRPLEAKAGEVERDIVLKSKDQGTNNDSSTTESSKPSSAFSTPRASSVATPKGSVKGTPRERSTPAPTKYVSQMAKAREEKKRRKAADSDGKSKDWPSLSDMETSSSNPSSGSVHSDLSNGKVAATLPKFGEWDSNSGNSDPAYTLLFQNVAQEKKSGGPIRVHASHPSPPRTEDLYRFTPATVIKPKKRKHYSFLCCFSF